MIVIQDVSEVGSDETGLYLFSRAGPCREQTFVGERVAALLAAGATDRGLLFVARDGPVVVGRVGVASGPVPDEPAHLLWPLMPADGDVAVELLRRTLVAAMRSGRTALRYRGEVGLERDERVIRALEALGAKPVQQKVAFCLERRDWRQATPGEIRFTPASALGDEPWFELLTACLTGLLDPDDAARIASEGPRSAARELWRRLASYPGGTALAEAIVLPSGQPVGLHVPSWLGPKEGTAGFLAVAPEFRGRGFASEALRRLSSVLFEAGADRVYADTDVRNDAMKRTFLRCGFALTRPVKIFGFPISSLEL